MVFSVVLLTFGIVNMAELLDFVQAVSAVAMAGIAYCALTQWKKDKVYSEKRGISVALNRINSVVVSFGPLVFEAQKIIQKDCADQRREYFRDGIARAKKQVNQECLDLSAAQVNTFVQTTNLSDFHATKVHTKINEFLYMLLAFTVDEDKEFMFGLKGSDYKAVQRIASIEDDYVELKNFIEKAVVVYNH